MFLVLGFSTFTAYASETGNPADAHIVTRPFRAADAANATLVKHALQGRDIVRARSMEADLSAIRSLRQSALLDSEKRMRISFFDDAEFLVTIKHTEPTASGGLAHIGNVNGSPASTAILVDNAGTISFSVVTSGKGFALYGSSESGFVAVETSPVSLSDHPAIKSKRATQPISQRQASGQASKVLLELVANKRASAAEKATPTVDDGSTIDVMVLYTPSARLAQTPGTTAQMHANIDAQIALTNLIYANSNAVQRVRLVYKGETTHTEANTTTDLARLENPSDGFLDEVPVLRDLYQADLVSLWGTYADACGQGSVMDTESAAFAPSGYNVVSSPTCTGPGGYSFAHELGHNMGLLHDPYVDATSTTLVTPEGSASLTSITYAHGYVDLANRFRSVMAYDDKCQAQFFSCLRIPYFSNPLVNFNNSAYYAMAVSAPTGQLPTSHESRALNDTRETVANFRTGLSTFTGPGIIAFLPASYTVAEGAGSVQVTVGRHVGSTGAVSINYATADGTAVAGSDYTAVSGTLSWVDGDSTTRTITIPIIQDLLVDPNESFTISLSNATGGAAIGSATGASATATVTIADDDLPGVVVFRQSTPLTVAEAMPMVSLRIARTVDSKGTISVNYSTINESAVGGQDFVAVSGTLTWADGDASDRIVTIPIVQDALLEGTESFSIVLSGATGGASIGVAGGTSTALRINIIDDEGDPFPAAGVLPAGFVTPASSPGAWTVDSNDGYLSPTSLRSAATIGGGNLANPNSWTFVNSDLEFTGNFVAGSVNFAYKVSSHVLTNQNSALGELEFWIDNQLVFSSGGGETGWLTTARPISAGTHTLRWRFKNRYPLPCAQAQPPAPGGDSCADRAWIDSVSLPLDGATLTVLKAGNGLGNVSGVGINCGSDCVETLAAGTSVTLAATALNNSQFAGWSGAGCSGTGTCTVLLSASQSVTANFTDPFPTDCLMPAGWTTPASANAGWSIATDRAGSGRCSLKSNAILDNQKAQIEVSGNYLAGNVAFSYNVSSEGGYDCLQFLVDGVPRAELGACASGEVNTWLQVSVPITAGNHTFAWVYQKDSSSFSGLDAAWIDDVALPPAGFSLLSVFSRKTHGSQGDFDVPINTSASINGAVTVEPRVIGSGHTIVFRFSAPISSPGVASAIDAAMMPVTIGSTTFSGNDVIVTLPAVADRRRVQLNLAGVNGSIDANAALGFFVGDISNSRSVNATDISAVKARSGQSANTTNFRSDVNASGGINATDNSAVKARSGQVLP